MHVYTNSNIRELQIQFYSMSYYNQKDLMFQDHPGNEIMPYFYIINDLRLLMQTNMSKKK